MKKKFELTKETMRLGRRILYRIKALRDFGDVEKGDLGGFIEKEKNLSHEGNCWIKDNAYVSGDALIYDDAHVYNNARVCENGRVFYDARVYGDAHVYGSAWISSDAHVYGNARVYGSAWIKDNACICDNAHVYGNIVIPDHVQIFDNAKIKSLDDIYYTLPVGPNHTSATFIRCKDNIIKVTCGCFKGTLDDFRDNVKETYGDNQYTKEYLAIADVAELRFNRKMR